MSALKRPLSPARNSGKRQYITLDVIAINLKEYAILCIGTPIAVMLHIFSDTLAISFPIFKAMLNNGDSFKGRHRNSELLRGLTILDDLKIIMLLLLPSKLSLL